MGLVSCIHGFDGFFVPRLRPRFSPCIFMFSLLESLRSSSISGFGNTPSTPFTIHHSPPLNLPWSSPALDVMDDPAPRKSAAGVCQSRRPHKNSPQRPTPFDLREAQITSEPQLAQPIFILPLSNSSYPAPHPYLHVSWLLRALYLWGLCHLSEVRLRCV